MKKVLPSLLAALVLIAPCVSAEPSRIRSDGAVVLGGKAVFPFGVYHVSSVGERRMDERQVQDLGQIADVGMNLVMPNVDPDSYGDELFTTAQKRGVLLFPELYWKGKEFTVPHFKNHPALLGWNAGDDVNWPLVQPNYTPSALRKRAQELKALDPDHITYGAFLAFPYNEVKAYAGTVDVMGVECYPIGDPEKMVDGPLETCYAAWRNAVQSMEGSGTTVFALPQTTYVNEKTRATPTPQQLRNFVYSAIAEGVHGVLGYAFYDQTGLLPTRDPVLWASLPSLTQEVQELSPVILDGARESISTGISHAHASFFETSDELYVIAYNTHFAEGRSFTLSLPSPQYQLNKVLFKTPSSTPKVENSSLKLSLRAEEVQVIRLLKKNSSLPPQATPPPSVDQKFPRAKITVRNIPSLAAQKTITPSRSVAVTVRLLENSDKLPLSLSLAVNGQECSKPIKSIVGTEPLGTLQWSGKTLSLPYSVTLKFRLHSKGRLLFQHTVNQLSVNGSAVRKKLSSQTRADICAAFTGFKRS